MINVERCYPFRFGRVLCYNEHTVIHLTVQPDGDYIFQFVSRTCYSITGGRFDGEEGCSRFRSKEHQRLGELQVKTVAYTDTITRGGEICTYTSRYHLANGEVKQDSADVRCQS